LAGRAPLPIDFSFIFALGAAGIFNYLFAMKARIYRMGKAATQSGRGLVDDWVLEYEPVTPRRPEPLMGWTASEDTLNQVRLRFSTLDDAVNFARNKGIDYAVSPAHGRKVRPRNYSDNFRYVPEDDRIGQ
jgi:hypothetical protein